MSANEETTPSSGRDFTAGPKGLSALGFAEWYRDELLERWRDLDFAALERLVRAVEKARDSGRQVFIAGNGGSAATASHLATDLSKTASAGGKPPLRCQSLTDNVPYITAIGNDLGFDQIFVRQLENLLQKDDLLILVSGSGKSPNVLEAARYARKKGALTAGLLGFDGGPLKGLVDIPLLVESRQYGVIEDLHMSVGHILAFYLRQSR